MTDPRPGARRRREEGIRAVVAFPVRVGREVAGVLEFFSDLPLPRDAALLEVMANLGTQVGRVVERARAQEAQRLSEAKFAGIISISSDAIVSVDESQRIVFFNQGAEQIFGYGPRGAGRAAGAADPRAAAPGTGRSAGVRRLPVAARRMGERGRSPGGQGGAGFPRTRISKLSGRHPHLHRRRRTDRALPCDEALARRPRSWRAPTPSEHSPTWHHDLQEPLRL